jgi:hypothetical protein
MLYCERCGQCKYISDEHFIEIASVSGTEVRYLDCETQEVVDYGNSDVEATGDSEYECPHCNSGSIDFKWDGPAEDAINQRAEYTKDMNERMKKREEELVAARIQESDWDLTTN